MTAKTTTTATPAQVWIKQVSEFKTRALVEDGIDYRGNWGLARAFDSSVRTLANDPANAHQDGPWFLAQAHREVLAHLEVMQGCQS